VISVILPTYNRSLKVLRAIQSVLSYSGDEIELIVVDDGSTDDTVEKVSQIRDPRLRFFYYKPNKGVGFARNLGIDLSTKEYISFLDDDDQVICSEKLTEAVSFIKNNTEYDHFLFPVTNIYSYGKYTNYYLEGVRVVFWTDWFEGKINGDFFHILKRDMLGSIRFSINYPGPETAFWFSVVKKFKKALINNNLILVESDRTSEDSLTKKIWQRNCKAFYQQSKYYKDMLENFYQDLERLNKPLLKKMIFKYYATSILGLNLLTISPKYIIRLYGK